MDPRPILKLNNQGIMMLGEEQYEEAARIFRRAFKHLKAEMIAIKTGRVIEKLAPPATSPSSEDQELQQHVEASEGVASAPRTKQSIGTKTPELSKTPGATATRNKRKQHVRVNFASEHQDHQVQTNKRRKVLFVTPKQAPPSADSAPRASETQCEPLGRPLWLETTGDNSMMVLNVYASSIMYNYGYALHQLDQRTLRSNRKRSNEVSQAAMDTYGKAILLASHGNAPIVQWMACHNLQQLVLEIVSSTNVEMAAVAFHHGALEARKAEILRSMNSRNANGSSKNRVCLWVLSMLAIGGRETPELPASAA